MRASPEYQSDEFQNNHMERPISLLNTKFNLCPLQPSTSKEQLATGIAFTSNTKTGTMRIL